MHIVASPASEEMANISLNTQNRKCVECVGFVELFYTPYLFQKFSN